MKVEIDEIIYKHLLERDKELSALEAGGVDNWEFYCESLAEAGLLSQYLEEDDNDESAS